jgi:hypothetical protein
MVSNRNRKNFTKMPEGTDPSERERLARPSDKKSKSGDALGWMVRDAEKRIAKEQVELMASLENRKS